MPKEKFNFKQTYEELEKITGEFERGEIGLDEGVEKFKHALALAAKLKEYLAETENQVKEIKRKFSEEINEPEERE